MTILIIDNYDSFTYNLYQYLGELGATSIVKRNDEISSQEIEAMAPSHIVLSPGPGTPENPRDFGVCADVIDTWAKSIPTLGVCLGHQGIIARLGGRVVRAPTIVHGKTWRMRHFRGPLFSGIPEEFEAMRYHSLLGERATLPSCLEVTVETAEPELFTPREEHEPREVREARASQAQSEPLIMGVSHRDWPLHGIQFHPESIGTPFGKKILDNFLRITTPSSHNLAPVVPVAHEGEARNAS
ncbi:MAG: aminodeoxychorismate/anthranilate synthase component II [Deltaproteobacteria bacterium]|nr:aminodeoxychorismate/anthranilate synthase component II [Deltaproteobacteria bacterium]